MATVAYEEEVSERSQVTALPRGLRWRGGVLWINKKIDGKRYQRSTGCKTVEDGIEAYEVFLTEHGLQKPTAGSGRRLLTDRPKLPKGLYWKGSVIWLSRVVKDKHYNLSAGTDDIALAKKFLEDFNLKAFKQEKLGVKSRAKVTFEVLANRYLDQGRLNGLRTKTITRYSAVRDHFKTFLHTRGLAAADVQTLTPALVEDYKKWRATTPLNKNGWPIREGQQPDAPGAAAKTLQFEVQTVGTFFKQALRLGLVDENPVCHVQPVRVPEKKPVYLEEEEIVALLKAASSFEEWAKFRMSAPMASLLHDTIFTYLKTGMRLEELRHLQWTDLDFKRDEIAIRQEKDVENRQEIPLCAAAIKSLHAYAAETFDALDRKQRQALLIGWRMGQKELMALRLTDFDIERGVLPRCSTVRWNPKSTDRTIPLSPGLKPVLQSQPRCSNLVFPNPVGGGLWRFDVNTLIQRCAAHAGITKDIHTHTLRHTFATQLRKRGVALETIKELLGHSDIRDTLIYAHFSPEEAKAAIPKIDFF